MKRNLLPSLLITFFSVISISVQQNFTVPIQTDKGAVRGTVEQTVGNNIGYAAFRGIPYAQPPTGQLRFRPPVEANSWSGVLNATREPNRCPQLTPDGRFVGHEDCLYLNLYTPKIDAGASLPVMVFIHGGQFVTGTASSIQLGPDYLMDTRSIVLVVPQYRLGALGFLSLNHPNASGNAGLKDQVLALKWVQKNIKNFGGNPSSVTLFGQGAGAVAVELHKLSNMTNGLFHRSIAMSGSPLNPWAFSSNTKAEHFARNLGKKLGIKIGSRARLLTGLYNASTEDIIRATGSASFLLDLPVKPTFERKFSIGGQAFLTQCALLKYQSPDFRQLPHMLGFTDMESISFIRNITSLKALMRLSLRSLSVLSLPALHVFQVIRQIIRISAKSLNEISPQLLNEAIKIASSITFVAGIDRTQQLLAGGSAPIFYYRNSFNFSGALHNQRGIKLQGAGHGDDLAHIFRISVNQSFEVDVNGQVALHRQRMVRMWTNFARFGNPTPSGAADKLLNVTWNPSGKQGFHLNIGNDFYTMGLKFTESVVKAIQQASISIEGLLNGCARRRII